MRETTLGNYIEEGQVRRKTSGLLSIHQRGIKLSSGNRATYASSVVPLSRDTDSGRAGSGSPTAGGVC